MARETTARRRPSPKVLVKNRLALGRFGKVIVTIHMQSAALQPGITTGGRNNSRTGDNPVRVGHRGQSEPLPWSWGRESLLTPVVAPCAGLRHRKAGPADCLASFSRLGNATGNCPE